jgi:hypothetical protein
MRNSFEPRTALNFFLRRLGGPLVIRPWSGDTNKSAREARKE